MGVKGLQSFMDHCCPEACVTVNLREMARQYAAKTMTSPTLVVDGMACLRHWYSCKDWVCGGQWKEYTARLKEWLDTFTSAGIGLIFFFDGVVEEQKRQEWVRRRQKVNNDIAKVFSYVKIHGEQPGRNLFCLPSGISTFTCIAIRLLGHKVFRSVKEADYEIARYAHEQSCMGILGQDSDFIIYDSAPYLSVAKLHIERLTTVLYDRQRLCQAIGLTITQLPLLACLLGNDVVSEKRMQHIRSTAMATYRSTHPTSQTPHSGSSQGQMVHAVSKFLSTLWAKGEDETWLIPQSLNLSAPDRELVKKGIQSYLLPGEGASKLGDILACPPRSAFDKYVSPEILKACREKHISAEHFMVYGVLYEGLLECSNTLEDEEDTELLPQALAYRSSRQHIYSLLLLNAHNGRAEELPAVKEWFVYPGNPLREPEMINPIPFGNQPSLDLLWFGSGPEFSALRLKSFFAIFDCQEFSELHEAVEDFLLAAICLVTYIVLQVPSLSSEDVDAYLSQTVCLKQKSAKELQQIKLPFLCSRAVQLGSLYIRGLGHLLGANCATGCPLPCAALMPWHSFDGRLFHSKYLLAHSGVEATVLLDSDPSSLSLFLYLKNKVVDACGKRKRVLQSSPKHCTAQQSPRTQTLEHGYRHIGQPLSGGESWRKRGWGTGSHQHGGWRRERGHPSDNLQESEDKDGGQSFHSHLYPHPGDQGLRTMSSPPNQPRGRWRHRRGRYQLAPRWPQPPAP